MRKLLFFLLAPFLFLSNGYAQDVDPSQENQTKSKGTYLFFSGGYVSSMLQGTLIENELENWSETKLVREPGSSFYFGIKQELAPNVFVKAGVMRITKSGRIYASPYRYRTKASGTYLSVPVLIGGQTNWLNNLIRIGVEVGGSMNFKLIEDTYNLTAGLNDNARRSVSHYSKSRSFIAGLNAEIKASEAVSFFANYSFVKDLSPIFSRTISIGSGTVSYRSDIISGGIMLKVFK